MTSCLLDFNLHFVFQLDLPFSQTFYRWLLHEESTLSLGDLAFVAPEIQSTLVRLQNLVYERNIIISNPDLSPCEKTEKVSFFFFHFVGVIVNVKLFLILNNIT